MSRLRSLAVLAAVALAACGSSSTLVQVPPRVALAPYGKVGLVTFSTATARGGIANYATERFAEEVLAAQPGIELLEIDDADSLLALAGDEMGSAFAKRIGDAYGVPAVFVGSVEVGSMKPNGVVESLRNLDVGAEVTAQLQVKLLATQSGGTLWRGSATATEKVGGLTVVGGRPSISGRDPKEAYADAVHRMVDDAMGDLRPTWVRQRTD